MRQKEEMLRQKGSLELLNYLRPHIGRLPELSKRAMWDDSERHMLDLFRDMSHALGPHQGTHRQREGGAQDLP